MKDLAVRLVCERNELAHEFLRETMLKICVHPEMVQPALDRLDKINRLAKNLMAILSGYTADMTEGYDWHAIQVRMNRGR